MCGAIGRAVPLDARDHWTCSTTGQATSFDLQHHVKRSIGRIGARNATVTETLCEGLECVFDVGALVLAGWVQRISVFAEQPCPADNAVVNHNGGN
jgi:hypothetical protein